MVALREWMPDIVRVHYPWRLTKRLLESVPLLKAGIWPKDSALPEGYKGQPSENASYEAAINAYADLEAALKRLQKRDTWLAWMVHDAYWRLNTRWWYHGTSGPEARPRHVQAIWKELNGADTTREGLDSNSRVKIAFQLE